jgi:hypothetical protein
MQGVRFVPDLNTVCSVTLGVTQMALAVRPKIDFSSRLAALIAVCEDIGLPANQVPSQGAANSPRTYLRYINNCRTALSLPLYISLDYTKFNSAINEIAAAAGAARPEIVTNPFASSNATPPITGSVLNCTQGIWLNASGASYAYQWKKNGTNIGTNSANYTLLVGDVGSGAVFTCGVTATTAAGASTPATSNPVTVP